MKAGEIRLGAGVGKLVERAIEEAPRSLELQRANTFEEGQISGPFGSQFAGYGPMTLRLHWLNWRGTVAIAAALFVSSMLLAAVV